MNNKKMTSSSSRWVRKQRNYELDTVKYVISLERNTITQLTKS